MSEEAARQSGHETRPVRKSPRQWRRNLGKHLRLAIGGAFLAGLAVAALVGANHPFRLVHVLPHEGRTEYELNVFAEGRSLSSKEVARRYRIRFRGSSALTPRGLRQVVRHREQNAVSETDTFVRLHLHPVGRAEEVWLWPEN